MLRLVGEASATVRLGEMYRDAGAIALDARDAAVPVTTLGLSALLQALAVAAADPGSLGLAGENGLHGPWVLIYTARDAAGNVSPSVTRSVYIDASCPQGSAWCSLSRTCVETTCLPAAVTTFLGLGEVQDGNDRYTPPVDTQPPVLLLAELPGDQRVAGLSVPAGVSAIILSRWQLGQALFHDPGWQAEDDVDGNVTASVSRQGLQEVQAAALAGIPTAEEAPLMIRYRVADSAGNEAQAVRAVWLTCPAPETLCETAAGESVCTIEGLCVARPAADAGVADKDRVELVLVGDETVYVAQGDPYMKCSRKQPLHVLCDPVRS